MADASCVICEHPEQAAIDAALDGGASLRQLEEQFPGVKRSTLSRHQHHRGENAALPEEMSMSTTPPMMAQRASDQVLPAPLPLAAEPPPVSEIADPEQAPLPAGGPLLTVAEAQAALDQVHQQLAQLPTQRRDLQQQLHALIAQVRDLERRVDREPGLDAPLAEARRSFTALDHYYDHTFPAEEKALKAREQEAEAALRQAEIAVALEAYNDLALQRPALWQQLSSHLDALGATMRELLALTQQQRDLAATAGFEFPTGAHNPTRLIALALYGTLSRIVPTPPALQEVRLPMRPYVDHDKAADLVSHQTVQQAPPMVWVQLTNRQRGIAFAPIELPFTGAEVRQLEMGEAVRMAQATFHTLRRQQIANELLSLVPEPTWT